MQRIAAHWLPPYSLHEGGLGKVIVGVVLQIKNDGRGGPLLHSCHCHTADTTIERKEVAAPRPGSSSFYQLRNAALKRRRASRPLATSAGSTVLSAIGIRTGFS